MNWIILIIAGLFETGFATCLGKAQETTGRESYFWWSGFVIALFISMFLMYKAISVGSNPIPIGTAYAVWTGIGAVGGVLAGIFMYFFAKNRKAQNQEVIFFMIFYFWDLCFMKVIFEV